MSKEKKPVEVPSRDPVFNDATFTYNNVLAIPDELKKYLTGQGLDWRFLNAREFRQSGNYHRSYWKPFTVPAELSAITNTTAEGLISRGDLILGVRAKSITAKHKEYLANKNRALAGYAKGQAQEMRKEIAAKGMSDHVKVEEGYDEDEKGFN